MAGNWCHTPFHQVRGQRPFYKRGHGPRCVCKEFSNPLYTSPTQALNLSRNISTLNHSKILKHAHKQTTKTRACSALGQERCYCVNKGWGWMASRADSFCLVLSRSPRVSPADATDLTALYLSFTSNSLQGEEEGQKLFSVIHPMWQCLDLPGRWCNVSGEAELKRWVVWRYCLTLCECNTGVNRTEITLMVHLPLILLKTLYFC